MPFCLTSFASFAGHVVSAAVFFGFEHEQEVCDRFDRREIVFLLAAENG